MKNTTYHYHHTKTKGDIALTKVIADLTEKGYNVFLPIGGEHLPYDLIVDVDSKLLKIQVKYNVNTTLSKSKKYNLNDFDYFASYNPYYNKIIYPHISYKGSNINFEIPNCANLFYWYEDFLNFTNPGVEKKSYKNFGYEITKSVQSHMSIANKRTSSKFFKVTRPSKEELENLVLQKPLLHIAKDFGVSNSAIKKWCKTYSIKTPNKGYWNKFKK